MRVPFTWGRIYRYCAEVAARECRSFGRFGASNAPNLAQDEIGESFADAGKARVTERINLRGAEDLADLG